MRWVETHVWVSGVNGDGWGADHTAVLQDVVVIVNTRPHPKYILVARTYIYS